MISEKFAWPCGLHKSVNILKKTVTMTMASDMVTLLSTDNLIGKGKASIKTLVRWMNASHFGLYIQNTTSTCSNKKLLYKFS